MKKYEKPDMEIVYLSLNTAVRTTDEDWTIGGGAFNSSQNGEPEWA